MKVLRDIRDSRDPGLVQSWNKEVMKVTKLWLSEVKRNYEVMIAVKSWGEVK